MWSKVQRCFFLLLFFLGNTIEEPPVPREGFNRFDLWDDNDVVEEPTVPREGFNRFDPQDDNDVVAKLPVLPEDFNLMAPHMDDVMHLCRETSARAEIKVAFKSSTKTAKCAGGGALAGGLLGGPPGMLFGGVVGVVWGWLTSDKFRPVPQILMELSADQRQKLYGEVVPFLINLVWTNKAQLVALVTGNTTLLQRVTTAVLNFVTRELGSKVRQRD